MTGTPFFGDRLREAREARDFSILQVAEYLGITKQAVSLYEKSKCKPSPEIFHKIVELLRVPPHYFFRECLPEHTTATNYRSMAAATKRMRNVAQMKLRWLREIVHYYSGVLDIPAVSLPECKFPADPLKLSFDEIEQAAIDLRKFWSLGDGVISHVVHLMESKGIIVGRVQLDTEKIDGFSMIEDGTGRPYVVLASDKNTLFRSRMDAAHELGHLILHRNVPKQVLNDAQAFKAMEVQAFRFAGAFLMPAKTFSCEYLTSNLDSFLSIKLKWKASIGSMVKRSVALDMITESQERSFMIERGRRGWNVEEPYDRDYEPERPHLLPTALEMIWKGGGVPKDTIAFDIALNKSDIEAITSAEGFFSEPPEDHGPQEILKFPQVA